MDTLYTSRLSLHITIATSFFVVVIFFLASPFPALHLLSCVFFFCVLEASERVFAVECLLDEDEDEETNQD